MTLGGNVCIRNGNELDYCWREAVASLLPVTDEVVVCDGMSTDGTQEEIREWITREPKIKLCVYPWKDPKGDIDFWVNWLNFCRIHVRSDFMIQLDADEVLSERSYPAVLKIKEMLYPQYFSVWCSRYNFWRDEKHLIPPGVCLSDRVIRIAPQNVWLPSDGVHRNGGEAVGMARDWKEQIQIFHYGFLRKPEAFFKKARALQGYFFDSYDYRLANVENDPKWMETIKEVEWIDRLIEYNGPHPIIAQPWLKERGFL